MSDRLEWSERPAASDAAGWVIALHGRGTVGSDLEPLADAVGLENLGWIFPDAPLPFPGGFGGRMWYESGDEQEVHIRRSRLLLFGLLDDLISTRRIEAQKIILMGFSQGAVMSLEAGLRYPRRLAAILALSGYLFRPQALEKERSSDSARIPILLVHGKLDDVVPVDGSRDAQATLRGLGYEVRLQEYLMGHQVIPEEIDLIRAQLTENLGLVTGG